MGTAVKHHVPERVKPSFVIFDIRALSRSALSVRVPRSQKLQMTGLTRSSTGCFIAVPIWQQWASKGYKNYSNLVVESVDRRRPAVEAALSEVGRSCPPAVASLPPGSTRSAAVHCNQRGLVAPLRCTRS